MLRKGPLMQTEVDFVIMNNTRKPRTGGDYVFAVMRDELTQQGYRVSETSIPSLLDYLKARGSADRMRRASLLSKEVLAFFLCYTSSLRRFMMTQHVIITSSCPTFPVFGHLTYHQPKAGILTKLRVESGSARRRIGFKIEEDEKLSPLWLVTKRLIRLHLSNSEFTKDLVKKIYGVDSIVLYPPVPVSKYICIDTSEIRKPYVLITRPEGATGISALSKIAQHLPKNIKFIIIGKIDQAGINTLRELKNIGTEFDYLGYVEEQRKATILGQCSAYIDLAANETFGISVVEAMAAGCVPIAHNSGSIPEFLPRQFRYSDPQEASEMVEMYINSQSELRNDLRRIALRFDETYFRRRFVGFVKLLETWPKIEYHEDQDHGGKSPLEPSA
jgi:glycosyltransferase involved in cell wall biosynthesis